jgi:HK97 family phage prohead protease
MTRETMTFQAAELRFADGDEGAFGGYAALWDQPDTFGDVIRKGAFAKSLRRIKPALLWQHDPAAPIGAWSSLAEDERGLRADGRLVTATTRGAEARALMLAKAVDGLSIGFRAVRTERGQNGGRIIVELELWEISIVTMPAAFKARIDSVKAMPANTAAFVQAVRRAAAAIKGKS